MERRPGAMASRSNGANSTWSCETYVKTGHMMRGRDRAIEPLRCGVSRRRRLPRLPDMCPLWGLLIPLAAQLSAIHQDLRPVRVLAGVDSPLKGRAPGDIDFYVVRENNEGEYRRWRPLYEGTELRDGDAADGLHAPRLRPGDRYASSWQRRAAARHLGDKVERHHSHDAVLGRALCRVARDYPDIKTDQYHIDILTAHFCATPTGSMCGRLPFVSADILIALDPPASGSMPGSRPPADQPIGARIPPRCRSRARAPPRHRGGIRRSGD